MDVSNLQRLLNIKSKAYTIANAIEKPEISNKDEGNLVYELPIYGVIMDRDWQSFFGDDYAVSSKQVTEGLAKADGRDVLLRINSAGGDVIESYVMYNLIKSYMDKNKAVVSVTIDGIAASAAAHLFLLFDEREMPENAILMLHFCSSSVRGTVIQIESSLEIMKKIDKKILKIANSTFGSVDDLEGKLNRDWYIDADEYNQMTADNLSIKNQMERIKMSSEILKITQ